MKKNARNQSIKRPKIADVKSRQPSLRPPRDADEKNRRTEKESPSPTQFRSKAVIRAKAAGGGEADVQITTSPPPERPAISAETASGGPSIEVRLDPRITAGQMRDRSDIGITGLASAGEPIGSISLLQGGVVKALMLYPPSAANQQAFHLNLARQKNLDLGLSSFDVVTCTRTGGESATAFAIATSRDDARVAHVVQGATRELSIEAADSIPIVLYVEMAAVDLKNVLHVRGWCVVRTQILSIQVFLGQHQVAVGQMGRPRDDIAAIYPNYSNARASGFSMDYPLPPGEIPASIAVEAVAWSGSVSRVVVPVEVGAAIAAEAAPVVLPLAKVPAEVAVDPRRTIFVHCDTATLTLDGELLVSGWAVCATGVGEIGIRLDDDLVREAELGLPRPDVAAEHPGVTQARHSGFLLQTRVDPPAPGQHRVVIVIRNGLDDIRELTVEVTAAVAPVGTVFLEPEASLSGNDFRFQIDSPTVIGGSVAHPVSGRLLIEGWALARSGLERIDILIDGTSVGQAYYGTVRRDVEAAFPDWKDALRSGYIFHCPPNALENGAHVVSLQLKGKSGATFEYEFQISVQKDQEAEDYATIRRRLSQAEKDLYRDVIERLGTRPTFRILLTGVSSAASEQIAATLRALAAQAVGDWQLLAATDADGSAKILQMADQLGLRDHIVILAADAGRDALVPDATSGRLSLFGLLSPGDELGCDALAEITVAYGLHPETQFLYADEDRISPVSQSREPWFKPDWSPDLLLSTDYIGRPWFATAELVARSGIDPRSLGAPMGDYDAVLRCTELARRIHHIPKLLCRRGDADRPNHDDERRVLQAAVSRRDIEADLLPGCVAGTWRLKRTTPVTGKVSIIIPTCAAKGYVATCLKTLRENTAYRNFEIICIDNIPTDLAQWKKKVRKGADKIVDLPGAFNWSRFNNKAVEQADGEYLLFLNDDIEVQKKDWLDAMLEHAQRPEVGIVGPQLLYPDRKVQHAGIFLTTLGAGRHSFRFLAEDDPGYFGLALTQRNVIAVTGACMLMRRDVFEHLGRFEEAHEVINNDVDLCLRAWKAGLSIVYTPYAQLIHHELASRAKIKDIFDSGHFAEQWRALYAGGDPFFSPRLTKFADEYTPDTEPARPICASRPLFDKASIRRILAMKLDHIGDLITAMPALRRLRHHFPSARIHLLASGAAKAFFGGDGCVDEFIEFEFFHARSGLGQKGIVEADLVALGERLAPYEFDLAIDLRKQVETRHVLKYVPARFRAGYTQLNRFPWLDISLEWEGDNQLHRKTSHISTDLLRLVDVIAADGDAGRTDTPPAMTRSGLLPGSLPAAARALFRKPVAAVHPGVGAIMRQWLPEYFATVIDLLIERNGVNVVLVGGRDEADLAKEVLSHVVNRKHVVSLAGRTSLADLTATLGACSLYLGNNSGPQHIAAALGVPTVGIYSGVVDAAEWGPTGARAIALQRNMICSPCYLVKPEDCVRDMACLKRLEPAVVHQYCEMMLAKAVPAPAARAFADAVLGAAHRAVKPVEVPSKDRTRKNLTRTRLTVRAPSAPETAMVTKRPRPAPKLAVLAGGQAQRVARAPEPTDPAPRAKSKPKGRR
jgi:O-antigen biosynthesis protein